jgi:hypothetical protein
MWTAKDIRIVLDDDASEDEIVTVLVATPDGTLAIMAEVEWPKRVLTLRHLHIHSEELGPNEFGIKRLRWLGRAALEVLDADEIIVEGEIRTTGAGPGHRPRPLRFTRRGRP